MVSMIIEGISHKLESEITKALSRPNVHTKELPMDPATISLIISIVVPLIMAIAKELLPLLIDALKPKPAAV